MTKFWYHKFVDLYEASVGVLNVLTSGTGETLMSSLVNKVLTLKSLKAGTGITLTPTADEIEISSTSTSYTGSNLGVGKEVFSSLVVDDFQFRTLTAGTNITLTQNTDDIEIAASGGSGSLSLVTENITTSGQDSLVSISNIEGAYLFITNATKAQDSSGNGRNGTTTMLYVTNQSDGFTNRETCCNSNGSSGFLNLDAHVGSFLVIQSYSCWVRNRFLIGGDSLLIVDDGTANNRFRVWMDVINFGIKMELTIAGVIQFSCTVATGNKPVWNNVQFQIGPSGNALWIGGRQQTMTYTVGSSSNTEDLNSINAVSTLTRFRIGGQQIDLDSVYLFSKTLNDSERFSLLVEETEYVDVNEVLIRKDEIELTASTRLTIPWMSPPTGSNMVVMNQSGFLGIQDDFTQQDGGRNVILGDTSSITKNASSLDNIVITTSAGVNHVDFSNRLRNVIIGPEAAYQNTYSPNDSVFIGYQAGRTASPSSICIGSSAGRNGNITGQFVAIGAGAMSSVVGAQSVSIGTSSSSSGTGAVAIGNSCVTSGTRSTCIGSSINNSGLYALCCGNFINNSFQNVIVLNGSGIVTNTAKAGFYIRPVQSVAAPVVNVLSYNTGTFEAAYAQANQLPIEVLGSTPTAFTGRQYYDTSDNTLKIYDGTVWRSSEVFT